MPAIRDFSRSITTTSSGTTLVLSTPTYAEGDLLVAIIVSDTHASDTWSNNRSYTDLNDNIGFVNTCGLYIAWKYAGVSEPDVTFTRSLAESFNGVLISIRDVHPSIPFAGSPAGFVSANQVASARFALPQITTTINDSLILYAVASSAAGVPSLIEGPVQSLSAQDGLAESLGVGWGFKRAAGATPNNVFASLVSTGPGVNLALSIRPPEGGAAIIPGYTVTDSSTYITPLNSNSAYNGGTGLAATATSYFGTSLNGTSLANGVVSTSTTTAPPTDFGINNFHSVGTLSSTATNNQWSGATIRPPAPLNLSGRNVLVHIMPSTPRQLQFTKNVTSTQGGIALGLASGTANANYKVWHVHGSETSWAERRTPCVINDQATDGMIQSTGTLAPGSVATLGFFIVSNGTSATWTFASVWALDTTVVCGGNSTEPLNLSGIVTAYSNGHERYSALQQGAGQISYYGPIQIGDGGTNATYLNISKTATEFPSQYDKANKLVNYNSVNNVVGITFYPGATDYIDISNATFSSVSKYHWRWNALSSSSATVMTSNCLVINAGSVVMANGINLTDITFTSCDRIDKTTTNTLTGCSFESSTTATAALSITGSSQVELQAALDKLVSCQFINNTVGFRVIYTGSAAAITLSITSLTFEGNTTDLFWEAPADSPLTLNLSGTANISTTSSSNSNTISLIQTTLLVINNIEDGSTVKLYRTSNKEFLGGVQTVGSSPTGVDNVVVGSDPANEGKYQVTYSYNYTVNTDIYAVILCLGFKVLRSDFTLTVNDGQINASQQRDRQYQNIE